MTIEEAMEKTGTYFDRYILGVLRKNGYLDEKDQVSDAGIAFIEKKMLFKRFDSDLVKIERINDVLDEVSQGNKSIMLGEGLEIKGDTLKLDKNGEEIFKEYIGNCEKLKDKGIIDYRLVLEILKQFYLSSDKSVTTYEDSTISEKYPQGDESYRTSPLDLGENPEESMKQIASEFFEDLFTIEKDGKHVPVNDYAKTLLEATKTILSGKDSKYGTLMIYTTDNEMAKKNKWPIDNGSNGKKKIEDAEGKTIEKHCIFIPIPINQNGEKEVTLQKLYTFIHEISHSFEMSLRKDNSTIKKNPPRTARMLGENESMIFESLFSNFLYKKIEQNPEFIQLATTDESKRFVTQEDIFKYEHGPSRVRSKVLGSIFKIGCWFYQEEKDQYIDYEDPTIQKEVMESIFPGRYDLMPQDQIEAELAKLNVGIKRLKLMSEVHAYTNYQPNRYYFGNLLAPYIVNTILADKKTGIDMLKSFWATGISPDIDSNGGMEAVLKAIGIEITRDENGNIIDNPDGLPDIHVLTSEYNEWISNASRQNGDMFNGKTREQTAERGKYITGRELGSQVIEDIKDVEETNKKNAIITKQEKNIHQTKENQDIGE